MISPPVVQFHPKVHDILVVKSNHAIEKVEPIYPHVMVGLGCAIAIQMTMTKQNKFWSFSIILGV
jgi:hypothetical protein